MISLGKLSRKRRGKKLVLNWSNIRNYKCWRRWLKKQDCRWPESWTWAIWGSSHICHPWNVLYTWVLPAKTQPLRWQCVAENTWMVYVTEPSEDLHINFLKIWWMAVEIVLWLLKSKPPMWVPLLIIPATYQFGMICLFPQSLFVLCFWGLICKPTTK